MTENEANIYSIAYRDCKEVADSIDVNEEYGKASTILFYMDEILEALNIASQLQAIGTIEDFKALKEKNTSKKVEYQGEHEKCPTCGSFYVFGRHCTECGQAVDYD